MSKLKVSVLMALVIMLGLSVNGQEKHLSAAKKAKAEQDITARKHIDALKSGTLIVRLPSGHKKLSALQLKGGKKAVSKYQRKLTFENLELMKAFKENYSFSNILFIYDKDTKKLFSTNNPTIFLNEKLEIDTTITFNTNTPYYLLETERIPFDKQNSSSTGFAVLDKNLHVLESPFPYYVIEMKGFIAQKTPEMMVQKLESKLTEFHTMFGTQY